MGIFSRSESGTQRDSCWTQHQEHTASKKGMEIVLALAPNVVASFTKGRPDEQGQVDWQL